MNALVVFVKAPTPGSVKTRLCPPVPPERAAALYRAFAQDTFDHAGRVSSARTIVAYEPDARFPDLSWLSNPSAEAFQQVGATLGERLALAFESCLRDHSKAVIIGSDAPHIPPSVYADAFEELDRADLVLGPSADGGYYLVGLTRPEPRLFHDIPWSTDGVLLATRQRARELGVSTRLLSEQFDVDAFGDLKRLARMLMEGQASAPRTKEAIETLIDQDTLHAPAL